MRLRRYTRKQKFETILLNKIQDTFGPDPKLIGYGDWSTKQTLSGNVPTPGVSMRKLLSRKFDLVVDEYKTSKICSICKSSKTKKFLKQLHPDINRRKWEGDHLVPEMKN